jgi:hypothetical protein
MQLAPRKFRVGRPGSPLLHPVEFWGAPRHWQTGRDIAGQTSEAPKTVRLLDYAPAR